MQYLPVWYPKEREEMISMYHPCATERLFLPGLLPNEDAVIYLDTDMIFMAPPEELWAEFHRFNSRQILSIATFMKGFLKISESGSVSIPAFI